MRASETASRREDRRGRGDREEKLQIIVVGWLWHAGNLSVCKCALDANMDLIENTCMRNLT